MIISEVLKSGKDKLKKNNIANPVLESELLLSNVLNKSREYIIFNDKEKVQSDIIDNYNFFLEKRAKKEPLAYIIKKKNFWKSEFYVDRNVLIPRPDTEVIIEQTLKIINQKNCTNILEIGVGSGCILISLLKEKKYLKGTGIDLSLGSIKISKRNAKNLNVLKRIKLFKSDIDNFDVGKYDIIVSNPPYISNYNISSLEKDVRYYEPRNALSGGADGLVLLKKVIKKASKLIKVNGKLILEIGFDQKSKVKILLKRNGFFVNTVIKDLANNDRCIISSKIN